MPAGQPRLLDAAPESADWAGTLVWSWQGALHWRGSLSHWGCSGGRGNQRFEKTNAVTNTNNYIAFACLN